MKRSRRKQWRKVGWYFDGWPVALLPGWVIRFQATCRLRGLLR